MVVQYEECLHDSSSFFCKLTYSVRILIGITSNSQLTLACLLDTGARASLVQMVFLPGTLEESIEMIKPPLLRTENHEVFNFKVIVSLFVRSSYLRVCAWFWDCLKALLRHAVRDFDYRPMHSRNVLYRKEIRPLAFHSSGNHYD